MTNLSALRKEPFTNNHWDYADKIEFQLTGYHQVINPGTGRTKYTAFLSTWPKLTKEILAYPKLTPLKQPAYTPARKILEKLSLNGLRHVQKAEKIFKLVQNHFTWNNLYSIYPQKELKKLWKERQGTGADINYWLVALLKNANLKALPVMISTKSHGKVLLDYPLLSKFNHVIAAVKIKDRYYLLDAKDKNTTFRLLPIEDLNEVGLMLEVGKPGWIPLRSSEPTRTKALLNLDLAQGKASLSLSLQGQEAYKKRKHLISKAPKALVLAKINVANEEIPLQNTFVKNVKDLQRPLKINATYRLAESPDLPNILYIKPVLWNAYQENPFKSPQRLYPIDFNYAFEDAYIFSMAIPEGYKVESLPKSIKATTSDGSILFVYQSQVLGNRLQLLTKVKVFHATIHHQHYGGVRELFSRIVEKHQEMIVLKKIGEK